MGTQEDNIPIQDEQFEAYLDGALPNAGCEDLRTRMVAEESLRNEAALQMRIDHTLRKLFPVVESQSPAHNSLIPGDVQAPAGKSRRSIRRLLAIGAAAALAGILIAWLAQQDDASTPFFQRTPLADIYLDTIRNGFQPYYECRDDERFAATFARRQGTPLWLLPLPDGIAMLGLSYPGGLSRDTTAMLCTVNGEQVMVFVDRATADITQTTPPEHEGTNVFRKQHDGLVFYEVSRLDEPRLLQFLAVTKATSSGR
jgi:hypothetical protein